MSSSRKIIMIVAGALVAVLVLMAGIVFAAISLFGGASSAAAAACQQPDAVTSLLVKAPANAALVDAVQTVSTSASGVVNNRLMVAMLTGPNLESDGNPSAISKDGAFGAFMIQQPSVVHPDITVAEALNPALATNYMAPRYVKALNTIDPALWTTDPERAAESVAYAAENPRYDYYRTQGQDRVHQAFTNAVNAMKSRGISTDFASGSSSSPNSGTASGSFTALPDICNQYAKSTVTGIANSDQVNAVLKYASNLLGLPYVFGGNDPTKGLDCSSYTQLAFKAAGINLPRVSQDQWKATQRWLVPSGQEQPGDLVFFGGYLGKSAGPGHVGIVLDPSKHKMYNEPHTGAVARIDDYSSWGSDLMGFTRPIAAAPSGSSASTGGPVVAGRPTIVLDPGHGNAPNQPFVSGIVVDDYASTTPEMSQMYQVALAIRAQLGGQYNVIVTKDAVDAGVNLYQRAKIANDANAALLVTLHSDAGLDHGQVYYPQLGGIRYRADGTQAPPYDNQVVADASKRAAELMAQSRSKAEAKTVQAGSYADLIGWRTITASPPRMQKGNILTVSYFATVPNVYCEFGTGGDGGMTAEQINQYVNGVVAGIRASVPVG